MKRKKVIPSDGGQSHDNTFTFLQFLKLKYNFITPPIPFPLFNIPFVLSLTSSQILVLSLYFTLLLFYICMHKYIKQPAESI